MASALVIGALLSIVIESAGAIAGWWTVPGHSSIILAVQTQMASAAPVPPGTPLERLQRKAASASQSLNALAAAFVPEFLARHIEAALNRMQISLLRLAALATMSPLIAILIADTVIDALLARERRRLTGGRESGFVFHRLQKWRGMAIRLPAVLWMASPGATPLMLVLPVIGLPAVLYLWVHMVLFKRHV